MNPALATYVAPTAVAPTAVSPYVAGAPTYAEGVDIVPTPAAYTAPTYAAPGAAYAGAAAVSSNYAPTYVPYGQRAYPHPYPENYPYAPYYQAKNNRYPKRPVPHYYPKYERPHFPANYYTTSIHHASVYDPFYYKDWI
eukprot:NODE_3787_length_633_cov_581.253425_g2725_i0.p2 GENE.NODE_3787_length_633_cov_581.253425_g2725_i0~~NODE_3787_length_633_cov_581.253425_g2725_i0.p2  ORF type:complete len:156 (+),score=60.87 NODE_3787_length_633_cov_581.253425_g2725_i0:54-470(+)